MATIRSELTTQAPADEVWSAVRDIGALHTRLVPGFVVDTRLEPGARIVTFINGVTLREPIVTLDDEARRLVWTAEGGRAQHYNAALEVASLPRRGHVGRLDRRLPARRAPRLFLAGDRGGNGGDAAVAGRARGLEKEIEARDRSDAGVKRTRQLCISTDSQAYRGREPGIVSSADCERRTAAPAEKYCCSGHDGLRGAEGASRHISPGGGQHDPDGFHRRHRSSVVDQPLHGRMTLALKSTL